MQAWPPVVTSARRHNLPGRQLTCASAAGEGTMGERATGGKHSKLAPDGRKRQAVSCSLRIPTASSAQVHYRTARACISDLPSLADELLSHYPPKKTEKKGKEKREKEKKKVGTRDISNSRGVLSSEAYVSLWVVCESRGLACGDQTQQLLSLARKGGDDGSRTVSQ